MKNKLPILLAAVLGHSALAQTPQTAPSTELLGHEKDYTEANAQAAKAKSPTDRMPVAEIHARGGLPHLFEKLKKGGPVTIGYYGGSITAAPGWRTMTFDSLQKQFPQATLNLLNGSVGGSGSLVGVFRADNDLVAGKPDVVFIEFSLNDGSDVRDRPEEVTGALEGIIRKLRTANPETDICLVYTVTADGLEKAGQGIASNSISLHDHVAEHYNLPSINMGIEAAALFSEGKLVHKAPATPNGLTDDGKIIFSNDGSHPSEKGRLMNGEAAIRALQKLSELPATPSAARALPAPLSPIPWEKAKTLAVDGRGEFRGEWAKLTAANGPSCRRFGKKVYEWFPYLYRTVEPGASLTVRFRGTHIGFKGMEGPDSGVITVSMDGGTPVKQTLFTVYANQHVYVGAPLPAVPMGDHSVTWTLTDEVPPKEDLLSKKKTDEDFRKNPDKYKENSFSAGQIIVLGDLLDAAGNPLPKQTAMKSTLAAFRSLAMARDKIRRLKGSGNQCPFTVDLLPGTYPIEESLVLGPEDAGREGSSVIYRAAEPETVFLFWTRAMKLSDFSKVSELEELERFDLVARDQVVHLPIAGSGRLPLSRWPNQGMTAMAEIIKVGEKDNLTVNEDPSFANPAESDVASAIRAADNSLISLGWLEGEPTLEPSDPPAWRPISPKAAQP